MADGNGSTKSVNRRRWFQFSLRWLLVLCVVLSLPLGYIGWRIHRGRRIQEIARQLHERGYQLRGFGVPEFELTESHDLVWVGTADTEFSVESWVSLSRRIDDQKNNDLLWCWGFGPRLLGDATFIHPVGLSQIAVYVRHVGVQVPRGRGDVDSFWNLVSDLPELKELDLSTSTQKLLQSKNAVPTLHRLRHLEQLQIAHWMDDALLDAYQPPASLKSLTLSNVDGGSGTAWQRFFAKSQIDVLHLDKPARPKIMLAAARSLRSLVSIHVTDCTLDDEALKVVFALEPSGGLMITRSRIPEGDDRARRRLMAADLELHDLYFRGSDWKEFREEHWETLLGDSP